MKMMIRSFANLIVFAAVVLLGLTSGSSAWATGNSTQDMVTQIQNYTVSGDIQEEAAAEDLTAMLASVETAISQGDLTAEKSLLAGFVHALQGLEGKLVSTAAAISLTDAGNALSASL